jgi:hypothetical protein
LLRGTQDYKKKIQDSQSQGWYSNPDAPEAKAGVLIIIWHS